MKQVEEAQGRESELGLLLVTRRAKSWLKSYLKAEKRNAE